MPSKLDGASVEEARRVVEGLADRSLEALVTVASVAAEQPADVPLQTLMTRTILDAERCLRLRDAFERLFPP